MKGQDTTSTLRSRGDGRKEKMEGEGEKEGVIKEEGELERGREWEKQR